MWKASEMEHGAFWKPILKNSAFDLSVSLLSVYPEGTPPKIKEYTCTGYSLQHSMQLQNIRKNPNAHTWENGWIAYVTSKPWSDMQLYKIMKRLSNREWTPGYIVRWKKKKAKIYY